MSEHNDPVGYVIECNGNKVGEGPVRPILKFSAAHSMTPGALLYSQPVTLVEQLEDLLLEHAIAYDTEDGDWDENDWHERVIAAIEHRLPEDQ